MQWFRKRQEIEPADPRDERLAEVVKIAELAVHEAIKEAGHNIDMPDNVVWAAHRFQTIYDNDEIN